MRQTDRQRWRWTAIAAGAVLAAACARTAPGDGEGLEEFGTGGELQVQASPDRAMCAGGSLGMEATVVGGTGPYSFQWSAVPDCTASGCLSSASVENPQAAPTQTTLFEVTVTDSAGRTAVASSNLVVNPAPTVSASADQQTDPGMTVTLSGTTSGSGSWSCNRPDCALGAPGSLQTTASPTKSTLYTLNATSAEGCGARAETTVWVNLKLVSSVPKDGDEWPVNAKLLVEFDQPLLASSLSPSTVRMKDLDTGSDLPVASSLSADGRYLYLSPGSGYSVGSEYELTLVGGPSGILSDDPILPNRLAGDLQLAVLTTEADTTAPTIRYRIPAPDAVDVARNAAVVVSFSEALDPATVNATSFRVTGSAGDLAGSLTYDSSSFTVTFKPLDFFDANAPYTVTLTDLADLAANAMSASWSFTTGSSFDLDPPAVVGVTPADGETGVSAAAKVLVTFSEQVSPVTLQTGFVLATAAGAPMAGTITYDPATATATFSPSGVYESLTEYRVTVSQIADLAGNVMTAPFTSTFTTREVLFFDDFEGGTGKWSLNGSWDAAPRHYYSSTHSLTDSPGGRYAPNTSATASIGSTIDVRGHQSVSLQYWRRGIVEPRRDIMTLEYRLDGGEWTIANELWKPGGWRSDGFVLDTSGGNELEVRIRFDSNESRERDGIYVDDFLLQTP